jgi:hypothetical protein
MYVMYNMTCHVCAHLYITPLPSPYMHLTMGKNKKKQFVKMHVRYRSKK